MHKSTIALCAAMAFSASAFAQTSVWTTPPEGKMDLEQYPAGVMGLDMNFTETSRINRAAEGYITLYKDDVAIKQIPASNQFMYYTISGFDKDTETGTIHVDFYRTQDTAPTKEPGLYKVTVPEGFVLLGDDVANLTPNEALEFNFSINGEKQLSIFPAEGDITNARTFTLTFPAGSTVKFIDNTSTDMVTDEEGNQHLVTTHAAVFTSLGSEEEYIPEITTEGNVASITLPSSVDKPGRYHLVFNKGCFEITPAEGEMTESKEMTYSYNILAAPVLPSIDPGTQTFTELTPRNFNTGEEGAIDIWGYFQLSYKELSPEEQVTFLLPTTLQLAPIGEDGSPVLNNENIRFRIRNNPGGKQLYVIQNYDLDLCIPDAIVRPAPGDYFLVIPANTFQYKNGTRNPQMLFPVTIEAPESDNYNIDPENGSTLTEIKTITITFPGAKEITVAPRSFFAITNGVAEYAIQPAVDGDKMIVAIPHAITEYGTWTVNSPSRGILVDGYVPAVAVTYTIAEPVVYLAKPAIDPAEGTELEKIDSFTLTIAEGEVVVVNGEAALYAVENGKRAETPAATLTAALGVEPNQVVLSLASGQPASPADGSYVLVIPEELYATADAIAAEYEFNYTLKASGIEDLVNDGETVFDVYTAAGVCVLRNAAAGDVEALQPGLYIVNGKKVIIK